MGIGSGGDVLTSGEQSIFRVLRKRAIPPYFIFDVGANNGQFLHLVLNNIEVDNFSVHCFEPSQAAFKRLNESCGDDVRITLNNIAVGKEKGNAVLYFDNSGSGLASLTKRRLDHFGIDFNKSEKVASTTIDNYCAENAIGHIHLLKVDIEGHELDVFAGAKTMFDQRSIDIVTFEFGGCNIDTRTFFQDFWYFFKEVNMKLFRITPSGYLYAIESYKEIDEQFRTVNYIAVLNG